MAHLVATIDEKLINAALAKSGPIEGEEHREAKPIKVPYIGIGSQETPLGIKIPYPCRKEKTVIPWSVTLRWSVRNLRIDIREDIALFRADVRAKAEKFSYTEPLRGSFKVTLTGSTVLITLQSLKITLYIKPEGTRIDILTFDIIDKLPAELRQIKFDLPFKPNLDIPLPNGEKLSITAKPTGLALKKGHIVVSASLDALADPKSEEIKS
ncbi:MAG: hypothetical protein JRJ20_08470 [Deltaproteobacteria bacterium]|nr:hypothetical protein [Deltaproteobacteria bacterium]